MSEDTRTILKKLMRDALDEKDRQRLLCDPKVEERMRSQWDEAADRVNPVVGNRMWERIIARTMATNGVRKLWVYKITAIAASILLLLGVGSVVYWSHVKNRREVILNPNEMLVFDKQANTVRVKTVNAEEYSGWRNGVLSFENERLSMILTRLEPWFGRKIKCPKEIAEKYRFTFKVRDESLERILFMLSNTSPIKYREKDNEYELYIKGDK